MAYSKPESGVILFFWKHPFRVIGLLFGVQANTARNRVNRRVRHHRTTRVVCIDRVLHGLKTATAYFKATIPALFAKVQENMNFWLDDFTLYTKTENEILNAL